MNMRKGLQYFAIFMSGMVAGAIAYYEVYSLVMSARKSETASNNLGDWANAPRVESAATEGGYDHDGFSNEAPLDVQPLDPAQRVGSAVLGQFTGEGPAIPVAPVAPMTQPRAESLEREEGGPPWTRGEEYREAWIARRMAERAQRAERMRSNLFERAKLDERQATRFDVLVAAMNLRLRQAATQLRQAVESGEISRGEARARAMKEIGAAVALTYDELDRNMPANWRTATTNDPIDLWSFIDPQLWQEFRGVRGGPPRGWGSSRAAPGDDAGATSASGR